MDDPAAAAGHGASGAFDWSGWYAGLHVGGGEVDWTGDWCPSECEFPMSALDVNGALGGGQAGYNWQQDTMVYGVEGDVSLPSWEDTIQNCVYNGANCTSNGTASLDVLASIRGRVGVAIDRALIFATGGVALAIADFKGNCGGPCGKVSLDAFGGVVGGGVEYAVANNVSLRGEGLYYIFDKDKGLGGFVENNGGTPGHDSSGIGDAWVARVALNWLLP